MIKLEMEVSSMWKTLMHSLWIESDGGMLMDILMDGTQQRMMEL